MKQSVILVAISTSAVFGSIDTYMVRVQVNNFLFFIFFWSCYNYSLSGLSQAFFLSDFSLRAYNCSCQIRSSFHVSGELTQISSTGKIEFSYIPIPSRRPFLVDLLEVAGKFIPARVVYVAILAC